jgi:hypothetical protein
LVVNSVYIFAYTTHTHTHTHIHTYTHTHVRTCEGRGSSGGGCSGFFDVVVYFDLDLDEVALFVDACTHAHIHTHVYNTLTHACMHIHIIHTHTSVPMRRRSSLSFLWAHMPATTSSSVSSSCSAEMVSESVCV